MNFFNIADLLRTRVNDPRTLKKQWRIIGTQHKPYYIMTSICLDLVPIIIPSVCATNSTDIADSGDTFSKCTIIFCEKKVLIQSTSVNSTLINPLIRRPIIRTFANSNGFLIPFLLFPFKIHPIIRTFAISNKFFGPVLVRINGCLLKEL